MYRGVINGNTGKTAVLPKYSETLTLSQQEVVFLYAKYDLPSDVGKGEI